MPSAQKIVYDHFTEEANLAKYVMNGGYNIPTNPENADKVNYGRQRKGSNHFDNDASDKISGITMKMIYS